MPGIIINAHKAADPGSLVDLCPFGAICWSEEHGLEITAGCKVCKICVRKGPAGVFEYQEEAVSPIDKQNWRGIAVFAEATDGRIHPVTFELLGKAHELASRASQPVIVLLIGTQAQAEELLHYNVDQVFLYEDSILEHFRSDLFTTVFEDFVNRARPSVVLVGGTPMGRSLAPRVAARFRTGLTADCTSLDIQLNSDLDQIRPAFGGNVMAHIRTPNHRPQFATVRYKVFTAAPRETPGGSIACCSIPEEKLITRVQVLETTPKPPAQSLEDAEVIVVAGRGIRRKADLAMVEALTEQLGGQLAATRPLIEAGWADPRRQIGLSGRTVQPKLIITCGVSGAIQFVSGMKNAGCVIAINNDPQAQIFRVAHYGLVTDLYQVLPTLFERIKQVESNQPAAFVGGAI